MEIYDNPLTLEKLSSHIERAVTTTSTPKDAYQETLHFALRNCIWSNNVSCMQDIFKTYGDLDLNRNFGKGSLLCDAASAPLLAQGTQALEPLRLLLQKGADPGVSQDYHLLLEHYRQPLRAYKGTFTTYIDHMVEALKTNPALASTTSGHKEIAIESVTYVKNILFALCPALALPAAPPALSTTQPPAPMAGLGGSSDVLRAAIYEVIDSKRPAERAASGKINLTLH